MGFVAAGVMLSVSAFDRACAYTEKTLYTFCSVKNCADGSNPAGDLAMDHAGNLYGTTSAGGGTGAGVVYEFVKNTGKYEVLYEFCSQGGCSDGSLPSRVKLVIDTAGNLYGTTVLGGNSDDGGVVFELTHKKSAWGEKVLYTFCTRKNCSDGGEPHDGLTYAGEAAGQLYDGTSPLYGTTYYGGLNSAGTVFALAPKKAGTKKWLETVLYSFCPQENCAGGELPDTPLYLDVSGNLYGTTQLGGQFSEGVVFELSPNGDGYAESALYSLCAQANCTDGEEPRGGVIMDSAGNLFGTTEVGGSAGDGVIFELAPSGSQWQYNVLGSFDGGDGHVPFGDLFLDPDGNLFGTTYRGGGRGKRGTVFEFSGSIQTLYSFCSADDCGGGRQPIAGVIEDSAGNLYGTTPAGGGHHGAGALYELSP